MIGLEKKNWENMGGYRERDGGRRGRSKTRGEPACMHGDIQMEKGA